MKLARTLRLSATTLLAAAAAAVAVPAGAAGATFGFDPTAGELPEGIAIDRQGAIYTSLSPRGEIRRIAPDGDTSTVAQLSPPGVGFGPLGLALDRRGTLYAAVATFDPASNGVYRVADDGSAERVPGSAAIVLPNALAFDDRGNLYVSDSVGAAVYRIAPGGAAELWASDPLLAGDGSFGFGVPIGANGLAVRHGSLYVAVTEPGRVVRIPVGPDGAAGAPALVAADPALVGADGIAFDARGALYVLANTQNALRRLAPGGAIETLATAADGLDFPAGLAFGRGPLDHGSVFIVNFAIAGPGGAGPGIAEIGVGAPGQPLP